MRNLSAVVFLRRSTRTLIVMLFIVIGVTLPLCGLSFAQSGNNDSHLYFFTSAGCAPCEMVKPALAQLDAAGYPVTIVDIRARPDWADHFHVDRTPTVIMVRDQQIVGRHAGVIDHGELLQWFKSSGFVPASQSANTGNRPDPGTNANPRGTQVVINEAESTNVRSATPKFGASTASFESATMHHGTSTPVNRYEAAALAATVKIKVEDNEGISYATGTVIHSHGNESLVVTCGHVFRDSQGTGEISGEYGFSGRRPATASGELIFYDADARDIALLVLKTNGDSIPAVEVASKRTTINKDDDAFSIGCDHGEDPTIRHTRIKNRAAYDGAIKYDIYGRPVDGRSGGGLFTDDGRLIGVCNAAVVDVDEGIYTALDTIHWQLAHTNLAHLFEPKSSSSASNGFASASAKPIAPSSPSSPSVRPTPQFPRSQPRSQGRSSLVSLRGAPTPSLGNNIDRPINGPDEVLIIVRSKDDRGMGTAKTITLPNPSHRLIDFLENLPPVKSEVRQIDAANYREANESSKQFRAHIRSGNLR